MEAAYTYETSKTAHLDTANIQERDQPEFHINSLVLYSRLENIFTYCESNVNYDYKQIDNGIAVGGISQYR
jgi:hypothetical protein